MQKKKVRSMFTLFCLLFIVLFLTTGCKETKTTQTSKSGAEQVEKIIKVPKNSKDNTVEQQNILDRLRVTTDPTKVLWIHLIALNGDIIKRMPVRNKVTSSGKSIEPRFAADTLGGYPNSGFRKPDSKCQWKTNEFLQLDGTYGGSDPYIYWFDPMGRYHQWGTAGGLGYLITDYPIDLEDPVDAVTGLYNMHKAAREWQFEQEKELIAKEVGSK